MKKRDPARIKRIIFLIEKYWINNPDLRLSQMISNFSNQAGFSVDPFYFEDDNLEQVLIKELELSDMVINPTNLEE